MADHEMELRQKREHTYELLNELKRKQDDMRHRKMDEHEMGTRRANVSSGSGCMPASQRMEHGHHGEGPSAEVLAVVNQMKALTDMVTAQANRQEELHQALLRSAQAENKSNYLQTQLMAE
eukprot:7088519-Pyramimonas_sp.AAC.1